MDDQSQPPFKHRTLVAQALGDGEIVTKPLVPPVHVSTAYQREVDNEYPSGLVYGRSDNLSIQQAEAVIAALEGAEAAALFSSGMAAATAVILALDEPAHIIATDSMYFVLRGWLQEIGRYGHSVTFVDTSDLAAVSAAVRPGETKLFWVETPSNPLWTVTDIAAISEIAHAADAILGVDSTVATPIFTRPLSLGADIVMHSATKYLNGHSDVVAGVLAVPSASALWSRIKKMRAQVGSTGGSFDAWLLTRGMRTLDLRVRAAATTAAWLAEQLCAHPQLVAVLYPGLNSHPGHEIALRQMVGGFGAMISIRLKGGASAAIEAASKVKLWRRATSFGGVESLIEHRASLEGPDSLCPADLLRLSVGLEDPDDLYRDLLLALESAN